ncbi:o-succinylbenzoate synthase [Marinithermofilum abyssi]|uniref:o-succinylbenzoate synthase n=1 Tax=Marinithermofilum abyssi TaxID=1571185 RepID=A0A8J2YEK9_9BACL|nr:o-succinylbenzoate synthase [Marinithermofilum abyssi]GGE25702.1 o-succinylbenzoate synthase [Marinithermofilum abyssi]
MKAVSIRKVTLYQIRMPLRAPFVTSLATVTDRELILAEVTDQDGMTGFGECVAFDTPWYTEETVKTAWHVMEDILIPLLLEESLAHPTEAAGRFALVRRHFMAKAALEGAVWDLFAKRAGVSLARYVGGTRERIASGVAIGAQPTLEAMVEQVGRRVAEGYRRIKVKIKPGADGEILSAIRQAYPEVPLMADANSSYTLQDIERLKEWDDLDLLMIEQPLAADDIIDHARLQQAIRTPVCLDESITSAEDVRKAVQLGSCRIINVKLGRVGGWTEALRIHEWCREHGVDLWCGGMLESGIARAHNIALASLPGFTLPGDISASARYWEKDVIHPEVVVEEGMIRVPTEPGIGVDLDWEYLEHVMVRKQSWTP